MPTDWELRAAERAGRAREEGERAARRGVGGYGAVAAGRRHLGSRMGARPGRAWGKGIGWKMGWVGAWGGPWLLGSRERAFGLGGQICVWVGMSQSRVLVRRGSW